MNMPTLSILIGLLMAVASPAHAEYQVEKPGVIEELLGIYAMTALIEEAGEVVTDPQLNRYVDRIFAKVSRSTIRDGETLVLILDSHDVNAFTTPGGYFAIMTGLLRFIESDDELACVLGHELGHHELKHGLSSLKAKLGFLVGLSVLDIFLGDPKTTEDQHRRQAIKFAAEIVSALIQLKFSRDHERQADHLAVQHTALAGYNPHACKDFFNRLIEEKGDVPALLAFTASHPPSRERVRAISATITEKGYRSNSYQRTNSRPKLPSYRGGIEMVGLVDPATMARAEKALIEMERFKNEVADLSDEDALAIFKQRVQ